jgi:hypothetical protein
MTDPSPLKFFSSEPTIMDTGGNPSGAKGMDQQDSPESPFSNLDRHSTDAREGLP